jgi:low temperature requirement protein LtrA
MGYFSYLADSYFATTAEGERIFRWWAPMPRAYLVPDEETEGRLRARLTWAHAPMLGAIVIVGAVAGPSFAPHPWLFFVYLVAASALGMGGMWMVLLPELRSLQPRQKEAALVKHWRATAERLSYAQLLLSLAGCVAFFAAGIGISFADPRNMPIAITCGAFFGACGLVFVYMLSLKARLGRK